MGKYHDVDCPICKEPLENGKVVVICPQCGAPYHKECVDREGHCIYDELHAQGKGWEIPRKETKYAADEPKRCSRCGTMNPMDGLFCEVCGTPLNRPEQKNGTNANTQYRPNMGQAEPNRQTGQNQQPFGGFQQPVNQMAYDPYTTPFGGVNPDGKIDEIPVKDWAIFIGQNTHYFIPRFKEMSESKRSSGFNFSAMIFNGFYFLYRKMYLWGILLLALFALLELPSLFISIDVVREMAGPNIKPLFTSESLVNLSYFCSMVRFVIMILCGTFTNKLYKIHCANKIKKIKETVSEHHEYVYSLTRTGGSSAKIILILVGLYFICSTVLAFLLLNGIV